MQQASAEVQRILITEDDGFLREMLASALRFAGFEVHAVSHGDEAPDGSPDVSARARRDGRDAA